MRSGAIRAKVDVELTRRVGTWFTVRDIQDRLKINPATLKPLIMKYARENVLKRRHIKGTARSVEFSPAAQSINGFQTLLVRAMPYRSVKTLEVTKKATTTKTPGRSPIKKNLNGKKDR